jgi:hypothetical protein
MTAMVADNKNSDFIACTNPVQNRVRETANQAALYICFNYWETWGIRANAIQSFIDFELKLISQSGALIVEVSKSANLSRSLGGKCKISASSWSIVFI